MREEGGSRGGAKRKNTPSLLPPLSAAARTNTKFAMFNRLLLMIMVKLLTHTHTLDAHTRARAHALGGGGDDKLLCAVVVAQQSTRHPPRHPTHNTSTHDAHRHGWGGKIAVAVWRGAPLLLRCAAEREGVVVMLLRDEHTTHAPNAIRRF